VLARKTIQPRAAHEPLGLVVEAGIKALGAHDRDQARTSVAIGCPALCAAAGVTDEQARTVATAIAAALVVPAAAYIPTAVENLITFLVGSKAQGHHNWECNPCPSKSY
jgi:hypothetical protein